MTSKDDIIVFLRAFSIFNRQQRISTIKHMTSVQCQILREVVYNLLFNSSIHISPKDRQYFNRRVNTLRMLASKRICAKEKRTILSTHQSLLKKVVHTVLNYLEETEKEEER